MKESKNFRKFLLLWSGELISSIGGQGVGRGAATVIAISGVCMAVTAASILFSKSIRKLEH